MQSHRNEIKLCNSNDRCFYFIFQRLLLSDFPAFNIRRREKNNEAGMAFDETRKHMVES